MFDTLSASAALCIVLSLVLSTADVSAVSADLGERPVSKVINLLIDMQTQLEKDAKQDQELYDQFACWCETNDKLKTKAIADAEIHLSDLETSIEELTAKSAQLATDILTLKSEISDNEVALKDATSIRRNDNSEFEEHEQDSMQMVGGLTGAVSTLSKHHAQPHTAAGNPALLQVRKVDMAVRGSEGQPVAASSYASQSGQIFGVLETMSDKMQADLVKSQKDESDAVSAFSQMKSSKKEELAAARKQYSEKKQELADADESNANSKADQRDTTVQLQSDQEFLKDVKDRCEAMDQEWEVRKSTRSEETQAVSEAIAILNDDDAKDLHHKTVGNPAFVQVWIARRQMLLRDRAAALLRHIAAKLKKPALANLAALLQNDDVFETLKNLITKMVGDREAEQADEVKQKDYCVANITTNEMAMTREHETKDDLDGKADDLENHLDSINKHLDAAKAEEAAQQLALQESAVNRGRENLAFQRERLEQRQTQEILAKALEKLQAFYAKGSFSQLAKKEVKAIRVPPPTFKPYKKAGGATGVVGILQNVIAESVQVEKEVTVAEQQAQAAYGEFTATSNKVLKALSDTIAATSEEKAAADGELVITKEQLMTSMNTIMDLGQVNKGMHRNCDYVLHNFDARQAARKEEIDGMNTALAMLSGADLSL